MLVILIATVLPDQSPPCEILLQLLQLIFFLIRNQSEPSLCHQCSKSVTLPLVVFDLYGFSDKNRDVFGGDHPRIQRREVTYLSIFTIGLVESIDMDFCLVFSRKFVIAGKDVFNLREDGVMHTSVPLINLHLIFLNDRFERFIRNIKELHEPLSPPKDLFGLCVDDDSVSSSDIVSVEWLIGVHLIFFWTSGC